MCFDNTYYSEFQLSIVLQVILSVKAVCLHRVWQINTGHLEIDYVT